VTTEYGINNEKYKLCDCRKGKKGKDSRNRPGVAQRVLGDLGSQISVTFGT
jgi:hypothetical protein